MAPNNPQDDLQTIELQRLFTGDVTHEGDTDDRDRTAPIQGKNIKAPRGTSIKTKKEIWEDKISARDVEDSPETSAFDEWYSSSKESDESNAPSRFHLLARVARPTRRTRWQMKKAANPLPWFQFSIILFLQLAEPLTSQVIYPFAPQLIRDLGITNGDERKVGYYVGLVESIFFLTQACTVLYWSRLSDRVGRKPIILFGLLGLSLSMYCFGLSRSFWTIVLSRSLNGALNGNIGVIKSMIVEMTDATNISKAYAYMPIAWSTGGTLGPILGGSLSRPTEQYPNFFGSSEFLKKYPYFLACAVPATFSAVACLVTYLFLEETLPSPVSIFQYFKSQGHKTNNSLAIDVSLPLLESEESGSSVGEKSLPMSSLLTRRVLVASANYASLSLIDIFFRALQPLFLATPIHLGGLGLTPSAIGHILSAFGILNGLTIVFLFPPVHDRWGSKNVFIAGIASGIPLFVLFPVISYFAIEHGLSAAVWILVAIQVVLSIMYSASYASIFIFIAAASPNRASLGATNGLSQLTVSVTRAIGPTMANSLFSLSIERNYLSGYMVYYVLLVFVFVALGISSMLPKHI